MLPDKLKMAENSAMFAHGGAKVQAVQSELLIQRLLRLLLLLVYADPRAQLLLLFGQRR